MALLSTSPARVLAPRSLPRLTVPAPTFSLVSAGSERRAMAVGRKKKTDVSFPSTIYPPLSLKLALLARSFVRVQFVSGILF